MLRLTCPGEGEIATFLKEQAGLSLTYAEVGSHPLARLVTPYARAVVRRFARDSAGAMQRAVVNGVR